ncbi:MAG: hypothetical protein ACFFA3_09910 [Promethearchaeota archaeon]
MENVENLETKAQKNIDIARKEKLIINDLKIAAIQEQKSSKLREKLVNNEIELAKLKLNLAEKSKKLVESKEQVKDILKFSNNNLKNEEDYAIYNTKIAVIKKSIAEIQRKIAHLEKQIANDELNIINEKIIVANERDLLGKEQLKFVKLVKYSAPNEKLTKAEELWLKQEKKLNHAIKNVYNKTIEIRAKEDRLADFKKELSVKLAEREKIRPPRDKFPTNE